MHRLHEEWLKIEQQRNLVQVIEDSANSKEERLKLPAKTHKTHRFFSTTLTLLHRSFIKSYRDVLVYGVRAAMYLGLAILMGTVWVRMSSSQDYIQPFINSIVSSHPALRYRN